MPEKQPVEQRPDPRFYARIAIFHGPYQKKILTDYSVNISTGGIFIETEMILPEGEEIIVKFNLPGFDSIITVNARVSWVNDPTALKKPSFPAGMGLQFLDLTLEDLHTIRVFLEKGAFKPTW